MFTAVEAELADDDLRTTEHVEIRHSGNHLSPIENDNFGEQERVNPDIRYSGHHLSPVMNDNFGGQEKVNPDSTLGPKPWKPNIIEDDNPRPRRSSRRQQLLSAVEMSGSCPTARQAASRRFPLEF